MINLVSSEKKDVRRLCEVIVRSNHAERKKINDEINIEFVDYVTTFIERCFNGSSTLYSAVMDYFSVDVVYPKELVIQYIKIKLLEVLVETPSITNVLFGHLRKSVVDLLENFVYEQDSELIKSLTDYKSFTVDKLHSTIRIQLLTTCIINEIKKNINNKTFTFMDDVTLGHSTIMSLIDSYNKKILDSVTEISVEMCNRKCKLVDVKLLYEQCKTIVSLAINTESFDMKDFIDYLPKYLLVKTKIELLM